MFKELFKVVEKIGRRDISEGREVVSTQYIKGKGWRNTFSDGTEEWDETAEILQPPKEIKGTKMHVAGYGGFDSEILDVPTALDDEGLADWFQTVIDDHSLDAPTPEEFVKGVRAGEVIFGDDEDGPIAFSQSKMKARKAVRQKAAEYAEDYEIEPRGGYVGSRPPTEGVGEADKPKFDRYGNSREDALWDKHSGDFGRRDYGNWNFTQRLKRAMLEPDAKDRLARLASSLDGVLKKKNKWTDADYTEEITDIIGKDADPEVIRKFATYLANIYNTATGRFVPSDGGGSR